MAVDLNMKVLIVDDYKTMLRILTNLLKQLNFSNIVEATDGTMALEKTSRGQIRAGYFRLEHGADDRHPVAACSSQ